MHTSHLQRLLLLLAHRPCRCICVSSSENARSPLCCGAGDPTKGVGNGAGLRATVVRLRLGGGSPVAAVAAAETPAATSIGGLRGVAGAAAGFLRAGAAAGFLLANVGARGSDVAAAGPPARCTKASSIANASSIDCIAPHSGRPALQATTLFEPSLRRCGAQGPRDDLTSG